MRFLLFVIGLSIGGLEFGLSLLDYLDDKAVKSRGAVAAFHSSLWSSQQRRPRGLFKTLSPVWGLQGCAVRTGAAAQHIESE